MKDKETLSVHSVHAEMVFDLDKEVADTKLIAEAIDDVAVSFR